MDKVQIAQGVADRLFATEAAVDQAMAEASLLVAEMLQARRTLKAAPASGDLAIAKISDAISTLAAARNAVVEAHGALNETKLRLGIRATMVGTPDKDDELSMTGVRELRRVS